ncbi:hypothetical protein [Pedobacter sandarakinus]|uniref:hypothetical protein n=1 Tax=Pedobacter sandarakinus TaxID=353156 RepID=UPI002245D033|nr:hypothetical protein [Pedobacter sandarakinus]MCX2574946.1 hypothetical protein [Pedobacter sandarakinus]
MKNLADLGEMINPANNTVIVDCTHLIDLPSTKQIFDQKVQGNSINNPKAKISVLTILYPKNGLANLL